MGSLVQQLISDLQNAPFTASVVSSLLGGAVALTGRALWERARLPRKRWAVAGGAALLAAVGLVPLSAGALGPVPFIFASGTVASADQLNANFAFLQGGVTAVEDQIIESTTRTRTLIIPSYAFQPQSSTDTSWSSTGALKRTTTGTGTFFAPVYLPEGAEITRLSAVVFDTSTAASSNVEVTLLRLVSGSFSPTAIGSYPTLNSDNIDPTDNMDEMAQSGSYVNNDSSSLVVRVRFNGSNAQFNNVFIEYNTGDL